MNNVFKVLIVFWSVLLTILLFCVIIYGIVFIIDFRKVDSSGFHGRDDERIGIEKITELTPLLLTDSLQSK